MELRQDEGVDRRDHRQCFMPYETNRFALKHIFASLFGEFEKHRKPPNCAKIYQLSQHQVERLFEEGAARCIASVTMHEMAGRLF